MRGRELSGGCGGGGGGGGTRGIILGRVVGERECFGRLLQLLVFAKIPTL
jgi:hypothetical protein